MPEPVPFNFAESPSIDGPAPAGYRRTIRSREIGSGEGDFAAAVTAVLHWQTHLGSGFIPVAVPPEVSVGAVSVFRIPFGPIRPVVTCRVFAAVDDATRGGFGHGALVGHPQQGWESYLVTLEPDGSVRLTIRVTARPAARWMALAGPLGLVALELVLLRNLHSLDASIAAARNG